MRTAFVSHLLKPKCALIFFFGEKRVPLQQNRITVGRLVAVVARQKRKVRAAQSTPLPNRKLSVKAE